MHTWFNKVHKEVGGVKKQDYFHMKSTWPEIKEYVRVAENKGRITRVTSHERQRHYLNVILHQRSTSLRHFQLGLQKVLLGKKTSIMPVFQSFTKHVFQSKVIDISLLPPCNSLLKLHYFRSN